MLYWLYIANEEEMTSTTKRSRYFLDINPELRNRVKAHAALHSKTMKDWLTEAIIAKIEDEIDAAEGISLLADIEGTKTLEEYLEKRNKKTDKSK
jgi:hypothetical protein